MAPRDGSRHEPAPSRRGARAPKLQTAKPTAHCVCLRRDLKKAVDPRHTLRVPEIRLSAYCISGSYDGLRDAGRASGHADTLRGRLGFRPAKIFFERPFPARARCGDRSLGHLPGGVAAPDKMSDV